MLTIKACPQVPYPRSFWTLPGCDRLPQAHKAGAMPGDGWGRAPRHGLSRVTRTAQNGPAPSRGMPEGETGSAQAGAAGTSPGHPRDMVGTSPGHPPGHDGNIAQSRVPPAPPAGQREHCHHLPFPRWARSWCSRGTGLSGNSVGRGQRGQV